VTETLLRAAAAGSMVTSNIALAPE
jgi:hypothetical protein